MRSEWMKLMTHVDYTCDPKQVIQSSHFWNDLVESVIGTMPRLGHGHEEYVEVVLSKFDYPLTMEQANQELRSLGLICDPYALIFANMSQDLLFIDKHPNYCLWDIESEGSIASYLAFGVPMGIRQGVRCDRSKSKYYWDSSWWLAGVGK